MILEVSARFKSGYVLTERLYIDVRRFFYFKNIKKKVREESNAFRVTVVELDHPWNRFSQPFAQVYYIMKENKILLETFIGVMRYFFTGLKWAWTGC